MQVANSKIDIVWKGFTCIGGVFDPLFSRRGYVLGICRESETEAQSAGHGDCFVLLCFHVRSPGLEFPFGAEHLDRFMRGRLKIDTEGETVSIPIAGHILSFNEQARLSVNINRTSAAEVDSRPVILFLQGPVDSDQRVKTEG